MKGAFLRVVESAVACLPLHDGLLVGESNVESVSEMMRAVGREILGFEPLVRSK